MRLKDISYDVGRVLGTNLRPVSDPGGKPETYSDFAVPFNGQSR